MKRHAEAASLDCQSVLARHAPHGPGHKGRGLIGIAVLGLVLSACTRFDDTSDSGFESTSDVNGMLSAEGWGEELPSDGRVVQTFEIDASTTHFMVSAQHGFGFPQLREIIDPEGNVVVDGAAWADSDEHLSTAFAPSHKTTAMGWPARAEDPPLNPGTWTVNWAVTQLDGSPSDGEAFFQVFRKTDTDLTQGRLVVRVVYADGLDADAVKVSAVDGAMDEVTDWFGQGGITVIDSYHSSTLACRPGAGGLDWFEQDFKGVVEEVADLGDIVLVVCDSLGPTALGVIPTVPQSMATNDYHYVAIGLDLLGGDDGFNANETSMVAHTIANGTAGALGLSKTVFLPNYDRFDSLDDTPRCNDMASCEAAMDTNLMYPHINCRADGPCIVNNQLTEGQLGMLHRSLYVR